MTRNLEAHSGSRPIIIRSSADYADFANSHFQVDEPFTAANHIDRTVIVLVAGSLVSDDAASTVGSSDHDSRREGAMRWLGRSAAAPAAPRFSRCTIAARTKAFTGSGGSL